VIGDAESAPTRIAFITIFLALIAVIPCVFILVYRDEKSPLLDKMLTGLFGLVTLALGYIFGSGTIGRRVGPNPRSRPK